MAGRTSTVFAYGLGTGMLGLSSIISVPAIIFSSDLDTWGTIAAGQAVGVIIAAVAVWGWGVTGPTLIAQSSLAVRRVEYAESLKARLILTPVLFAVGIGFIALFSKSGFSLVAALGCLSTGLVALTANWYFVGDSSPWKLFWLETAPRATSTFVAAAVMRLGASAEVGLLMICAGIVGATALSSLYIFHSTSAAKSQQLRPQSMRAVLINQGHGVLTNLSAALYMSLPIIIMSMIAPQHLPHFAVLDKTYKQFSTGFSPILNILQGWVPRAQGEALLHRVKVAVLISGGSAGVFIFGFTLWGSPLLIWLANYTASFTILETLLTASVVGIGLVEIVLARACMTALGKIGIVAKATLVGSLFGLIAVTFLSPQLGAAGALAGVLTGLGIRVAYQLTSLLKVNRSWKNEDRVEKTVS